MPSSINGPGARDHDCRSQDDTGGRRWRAGAGLLSLDPGSGRVPGGGSAERARGAGNAACHGRSICWWWTSTCRKWTVSPSCGLLREKDGPMASIPALVTSTESAAADFAAARAAGANYYLVKPVEPRAAGGIRARCFAGLRRERVPAAVRDRVARARGCRQRRSAGSRGSRRGMPRASMRFSAHSTP